jgi:hypothetical protein
MPTLHFVGEIVPFTQDTAWIRDIVAGYLPAGYAGNTLEEVARMVSDSLKKGYDAPKKTSNKLSAAQEANAIISRSTLEIFHTPQNEAFVAITEAGTGTRCVPVQSDFMKSWARLRYHKVTGKTLRKETLAEVIDLLEAKAIHDEPEKEVHIRLAGSNGDVYYDLGQPGKAFVRITSGGWTLEGDVPLRFHRPAGFGKQVAPKPGGNLTALRDLLHLDKKNWVLLLAFILVSLRPRHPYMVLLVSGVHGSGKSMFSELIKRILDPNALEKFRLPKEEHTLAIQAAKTRLLVYDNTSSVRWDISDGLCAMLTGGGFSTRKFYADDDLRIFKNARPAIINGIGEFANQHDLLDRAIAIKLPKLTEKTRMQEKELNTRFEAILPGFLGCLFDIVSMALRRFDEVEPPTTVRMVDAVQWLMAGEPATGLPIGTFLHALEASVRDVTIENTINHPLVIAILNLLDVGGANRTYEGTMGDLHKRLGDQYGRIPPSLPKTASHLSNALQRLAPGMAEIGLMVELLPRTRTARPVRIWIEQNELTPEQDEMQKRF